ncbi:MAG TPA: oligosaccharide flippase family protein, partial [Bacilli bacterium]|nr:oligosaccharide flippase family protein [Bacilli bacterium]
MGKKQELLKNTVIIFISKFCTQFLSFFLLPLYTAFLSTKEYGTYDLIVTYLSLLAPIITIQLENSMFRFLIDVRDNDSEKQKIISIIFKIVLSIIVILSLLAFVVFNFISIKYIDLIVLNMIACIFINLLLQVSRGLGKNKVFAIASSICGITTLVLNIVFVLVFKMKVDGLLISMLIANLISSIYLFIRLKLYRYLNFNVKDKKLAKELVKYSLPLIPNNISWWIINVSDRTIISLILGIAANGI